MATKDSPKPLIVPLGDGALLVRFGSALDEVANRAAIGFARRLENAGLDEIAEVTPTLVSVLVRFDPERADVARLAAELRLLIARGPAGDSRGRSHRVKVDFGGGAGPDLAEVSAALALTPEAFIAAHNSGPLRVLAIGFAPGFSYCGFHPEALRLPRRTKVRPRVPAGTVLFAAGQTAIAATDIPTGWHVIGRTALANFDAGRSPPVLLQPGDEVRFEVSD